MLRRSEPAWLGGILCGLLLMISTQALALEDPTRPPEVDNAISEVQPLPSLSLESILVSATRRVAVINGQACVEGQIIDGVRVRQIHRDRVEIAGAGRVQVLYLNKLPQVRGFQ